MSSHSCEFPVVIAASETDERDHRTLREPMMAWEPFAVVIALFVMAHAG